MKHFLFGIVFLLFISCKEKPVEFKLEDIIESAPRKLFWKLNRGDAAGNSNTTMPSKSFHLE